MFLGDSRCDEFDLDQGRQNYCIVSMSHEISFFFASSL